MWWWYSKINNIQPYNSPVFRWIWHFVAYAIQHSSPENRNQIEMARCSMLICAVVAVGSICFFSSLWFFLCIRWMSATPKPSQAKPSISPTQKQTTSFVLFTKYGIIAFRHCIETIFLYVCILCFFFPSLFCAVLKCYTIVANFSNSTEWRAYDVETRLKRWNCVCRFFFFLHSFLCSRNFALRF